MEVLSSKLFYVKKTVTLIVLFGLFKISSSDVLLHIVFGTLVLAILFTKKVSFNEDVIRIGWTNYSFNQIENISIVDGQLFKFSIFTFSGVPWYKKFQFALLQGLIYNKKLSNLIDKFQNLLLKKSSMKKQDILALYK